MKHKIYIITWDVIDYIPTKLTKEEQEEVLNKFNDVLEEAGQVGGSTNFIGKSGIMLI